MAVALAALVVALGGTSYAAVTLATHSVTQSKLAPRAVSISKIKPHAVSRSRIRPAAVSPSKLSVSVKRALAAQAGPTGPTGPTGPQGPSGTALAYGTFDKTGNARDKTTYNLAGLDVNHAAAGVYCYSKLPVAASNVTATPDAAGADAGATVAATLHDLPHCPAGTELEVDTFGPGGAAADQPFALALN